MIWVVPAYKPELDPGFDSALKEAINAGVKVYCRKCHITPEKIVLAERLPVI